MEKVTEDLSSRPACVSVSHQRDLARRVAKHSISAYTALMGALTNWSSTIYVILTQAYETDLTGLNLGSALNLLMLGIGNIVLIPLANSM